MSISWRSMFPRMLPDLIDSAAVAMSSPAASDDLFFFQIIESFPNMVFIKYGEEKTRHDFDKGFRYAYFNSIMDVVSGFRRLDMVGQNAKDHFPVHYKRYFDDDMAVMQLEAGNPLAVLELVEPWKVATGNHVLHTRKVNLENRYMLGTFIQADDVHLGKVEERRKPVSAPLSTPPPTPEGVAWRSVWEHLPVPVMVTFPSAAADKAELKPPLKNKAFLATFTSATTESTLNRLDDLVTEGHTYEKSGLELEGRPYHLLQRPIRFPKSDELVVVYVVWPTPDSRSVDAIRASLE